MKFRLNKDAIAKLKATIEDAWAIVIAELTEEYLRVIEDPEAFADLGFTSQDIVDTGRFRDSMTIDVQGLKITWNWNPIDPETGYAYAAALYYGFLAFGKYPVEGRPWTNRAIRNLDPVERLAAELTKRGLRARVTRNQTETLMQ